MKKLVILMFALSMAMFSGAMFAKNAKGNSDSDKKVTILHKNGKELSVSVSALPAHCRHNDTIVDESYNGPFPDGCAAPPEECDSDIGNLILGIWNFDFEGPELSASISGTACESDNLVSLTTAFIRDEFLQDASDFDCEVITTDLTTVVDGVQTFANISVICTPNDDNP